MSRSEIAAELQVEVTADLSDMSEKLQALLEDLRYIHRWGGRPTLPEVWWRALDDFTTATRSLSITAPTDPQVRSGDVSRATTQEKKTQDEEPSVDSSITLAPISGGAGSRVPPDEPEGAGNVRSETADAVDKSAATPDSDAHGSGPMQQPEDATSGPAIIRGFLSEHREQVFNVPEIYQAVVARGWATSSPSPRNMVANQLRKMSARAGSHIHREGFGKYVWREITVGEAAAAAAA